MSDWINYRGWRTRLTPVAIDTAEAIAGTFPEEIAVWHGNSGEDIGVKFPAKDPKHFAKYGTFILEQERDTPAGVDRIVQVLSKAQANFMKRQLGALA